MLKHFGGPMKISLSIIVLLLSFGTFANDKCPKFSKKSYQCTVTEDGDIRQEKAQILIKNVAGKRVFSFTSEDILNEIKLDNKTRMTESGFKYRAYCRSGRVIVDLKNLNIKMVIRGTKRRASVKAFLYGENISTAKCRR